MSSTNVATWPSLTTFDYMNLAKHLGSLCVQPLGFPLCEPLDCIVVSVFVFILGWLWQIENLRRECSRKIHFLRNLISHFPGCSPPRCHWIHGFNINLLNSSHRSCNWSIFQAAVWIIQKHKDCWSIIATIWSHVIWWQILPKSPNSSNEMVTLLPTFNMLSYFGANKNWSKRYKELHDVTRGGCNMQ